MKWAICYDLKITIIWKFMVEGYVYRLINILFTPVTCLKSNSIDELRFSNNLIFALPTAIAAQSKVSPAKNQFPARLLR